MVGLFVMRPTGNDSTTPLSISLPNGTTSLSLTSSFGSAAVVVTTVEIPATSLPTFSPLISNTTSTVGNAPAPQLLSSVLTIEISQTTTNGSFTAVPIPYFEANIKLSAAANQTVLTNVLVHNCTVGVPESVSIFCADTALRMNLTCSGRVAITVQRQCPLPRAVCSIVDLTNNRIVSNDFCSAVSLGTSVVCKCGGAGSNGSSIVATNRLSVGVFEVYGAGSFASSVVLASTLSVSDVAARSVSIFVFFGSMWGIGLCLLCVMYWDLVRWRKLKRTVPNEHDVERPLEGQDSRQELLRSILPPFFDTSASTGSWLFKKGWSRTLVRCHPYLRVCWEIYQRLRGNVSHYEDHVAQDIIHELTALTTACCVLAMLYDFQYPEDNGFCATQTSLETCEDRKMLLDPFQSQCLWQPSEEASSDTDDVIEELMSARLVNKIYLSNAMNHPSSASCRFNGSNNSTLAFILSYLIASLFQIVLRLCLERSMRILSAREQLTPQSKREAVESDISREETQLRTYPVRKVERLRDDRRVLEGSHLLRRNAIGAIDLMGESLQPRQLTPVVCITPNSMPETAQGIDLAVHKAAATMCSTDYAVTMLRLAVADHIGHHRAEERHVFLLGLFRAFPAVESVRHLWLWQCLAVVVLVVCNAGSLYFIVSKAATRRFEWQFSFLKIVAFEWFSDVVVLQTLEVACFDYCLCHLVQKEVEEVIQRLLLVSPLAKDEQLKRPNFCEVRDDFESPSKAMARLWPGLPESRWVQSVRSPDCEATLSTKRRLLKWLTYGTLETWETTISFVSAFMLAWLVFMYYRFVDDWFLSLPSFVYGVIAGVSLLVVAVLCRRMCLVNHHQVEDDGDRESNAPSGSVVWSLSSASESLASSWDWSVSLSSNDDDPNSLTHSSSSFSMVDKSLSISFSWSDRSGDPPSTYDRVVDESDDFDGLWDRLTSGDGDEFLHGEEGDDIDIDGTDISLSISEV